MPAACLGIKVEVQGTSAGGGCLVLKFLNTTSFYDIALECRQDWHMITAAEEVERALRLADSHQNSVSSTLNQQQVNPPSSSMNQKLTPHQVLKNTDTNLNHQKQADHQMMADINHNADHHNLIRDEHQTPIAISYQGAVDPTHQPLVSQSGLASQQNHQSYYMI